MITCNVGISCAASPPRDMDGLRFDLEPEEATFPLVHKKENEFPLHTNIELDGLPASRSRGAWSHLEA